MTPETQILLNLHRYFLQTRQCGHTTALVRGAENVDAKVLVHSLGMKDILKKVSKNKKDLDTITFSDLNNGSILAGFKKPLVIDNATMTILLKYALERIAHLEKENYALKEMVK